MPKRVLAVGVGGTGKAVLTILKERLLETYGRVPSNVVLLAIDTDDWRPQDAFAGVELNRETDQRGRAPEYLHVTTSARVTMDTIFTQLAQGHNEAYMGWLEWEKLDRQLGPSERDIRGGAQQRRPVGRVAFFTAWRTIESALREAINRMYGERDEEQQADKIELEKSKRLVFVVGSVAGGTGSGFFIDTANLIRRLIQQNPLWKSIDLSAIIVLPSAFEVFVKSMRDPTNLKPNSYAALREVDRFMRAHDAQTPYMVRYDANIDSITWCINQLFDHVYLADVSSTATSGDQDLSGDPWQGIFPAAADFIMAHVDTGLSDGMATLRANAGQHYNRVTGWVYSSFNIRSYIFPANDVARALTYRFLRHLLVRYYLMPPDDKHRVAVEQQATKEVERLFSQTTVHGRTNPTVIPLALAATRRVDPEPFSVTWTALFKMINLSEEGFTQDYGDIEGWLEYLSSRMVPSRTGEYQQEAFTDGFVRLRNVAAQFLDDFFGPQLDPDDEDARTGGELDKILSQYRPVLRARFGEALDAALLEVLNRRDERGRLVTDRLPVALTMVRILRERLMRFKELLEREYQRYNVETKLRHKSDEVREAVQRMQDTKDQEPNILQRLLNQRTEAMMAQEMYIDAFRERVMLMLHKRVYEALLDILDALGAAERDSDGQLSVLAYAERDLEGWTTTLENVDRIVARWARMLKNYRDQKRRIRVRYYLVNDELEEQLYRQLGGRMAARILGKVQGEPVMFWERRRENEPLRYKMTSHWTRQAKGAEEIARSFSEGLQRLFEQEIRQRVVVGDRLKEEFKGNASRFVTKTLEVEEPLLSYNEGLNGKGLFHEYYVAYNADSVQEETLDFLNDVGTTLRNQGYTVVDNTESIVACTVLEIGRGVRLTAVNQFQRSRNEYRRKIYEGRESLHLFPEEQLATEYEQLIEFLDDPDNKMRPLAPDLVVAMSEKIYVKTFTLACAYGLVKYEEFIDPDTGDSRFEVFLNFPNRRSRLRLSNRPTWQERDPRFKEVTANEQKARLYLQAFRNFSLLALRKRGVSRGLVNTLRANLDTLGVEYQYIDNPFTLEIRDVNEAIRHVQESVGPALEEVHNDEQRYRAENAKRRLDQFLMPFMQTVETFKRSPDQRVKDLGTVMHIVVRSEIDDLMELRTMRV